MKLNSQNLIAALALVGLFGGCATTIPAPLAEARDTFAALSSGPAGKLSQVELSDAKQILEKANQELAAHGDTNVCRDYAYIAQNKLELASVMAETEVDRRTMVEALEAGAANRSVHGAASSLSGISVSSDP
jgi:Domain of unknown function (DUF4398)